MNKGEVSKMTKEKGLHPTSPIHVHADDTHVHVKKGKKKTTLAKSSSNSRLQKATASSRARARSVSPPSKSGPWVPAPGKATRGGRISWQGANQKLEVGHLRSSDLSTDEEERVGGEVRCYEKKINTLLNEVGSLKNEGKTLNTCRLHCVAHELKLVVLQKALKEIEHKDDLLNSSTRMLERQEAELENVEEELAVTETENKILRQNMQLIAEEAEITNKELCTNKKQNDHETSSWSSSCSHHTSKCSSLNLYNTGSSSDVKSSVHLSDQRSEKDLLNYEREKLMKKLIEAEMDSQAAAHQVRDLKELIKRLRDNYHMSTADQARFAKQKELFLEAMAEFEASNRTLRRLLRDQHRIEASSLRLSEQRDVLMRKLADADMVNERMKNQLLDCESLISELRNQLHVEKEERVALGNLQGSLESTRAHLQKQLRLKEADCNRMAVQIRSLEGQLTKERVEKEHFQELSGSSKNRIDKDKETLKKAARAQKVRAERLEEEVSHLTKRLTELQCQGSEQTAKLTTTNSRFENLARERELLTKDCSLYRAKIAELEALVDRLESNAKAQNETLTSKIHERVTESTSMRLENERLKSTVTILEGKVRQSEEDVQQLRGTIKQYEKLVDEYKEQAGRTRHEADESFVKLEEQSREKERIQREGELELEKVKIRLHQRLQELEPLPEMLRATELKLHEANEKLSSFESRHADSMRIIADLTAKLEFHSETVEHFKHKCNDSQDSNRSLQSKYDQLERRLKELEDQNTELHTSQVKMQEVLHQESLRLEEKARENVSLTRQLENALSDNRQIQEHSRERFASKERTYQSRIADLETQLSQLRADLAKIMREKEENERKFNSRLYDLKDRLEQCHSTNRSMQNYVQFLKNSYSNVFGETSSSFPAPPSPVKQFP
ncbi:outer dense fiber protein 2-like isoform X3 [Biomphalaria glabrata]|uniref:Outer dense fiber protein 2-like isoform X3 n=1 Tax=Biomphalaria glabrata TaxID=6526 RepID=A0A9W3BC05_BIOGL|nr:outer dense fiber protein 2-like isoform X3 [Biomphalaria glabrata]